MANSKKGEIINLYFQSWLRCAVLYREIVLCRSQGGKWSFYATHTPLVNIQKAPHKKLNVHHFSKRSLFKFQINFQMGCCKRINKLCMTKQNSACKWQTVPPLRKMKDFNFPCSLRVYAGSHSSFWSHFNIKIQIEAVNYPRNQECKPTGPKLIIYC